jgi:phospholipase/carboxylesterase
MPNDWPRLSRYLVPPSLPAAIGQPTPTVVLLHGRGADEHDLLGLLPELPATCAYVSLRAPLPFPSGGYSWFTSDVAGLPDEPSFLQARRRLQGELEELRRRGGAPLAVVGFSQGAALAAALLLARAPADAFAVLSGFLPASAIAPDAAGAGAAAPVSPVPEPSPPPASAPAAFVAHGLHDPLVPVVVGRLVAARLQAAGARLTYREYDEGHAIGDEEARDLGIWLGTALAPGGRLP